MKEDVKKPGTSGAQNVGTRRALTVLNKHKKRMHLLRKMLQCNVFRLLHSTDSMRKGGSCKFSVQQ